MNNLFFKVVVIIDLYINYVYSLCFFMYVM